LKPFTSAKVSLRCTFADVTFYGP